MNTYEQIKNANVFPNITQTINGVFNPYKVVLTAQTPIIDGDKILLQFPNEVGFPTSLSCQAIDNLVNVTCEILSL